MRPMILKVLPNNKTKRTKAVSAHFSRELHPRSTSSNKRRVTYRRDSSTLIAALQNSIFLDPSQLNLKAQVYSIPIHCNKISNLGNNLSKILSLDLKAVSLNSSSSHNFSLFSTRVRIRPKTLSNKTNRAVFSTHSRNNRIPQHLSSILNSLLNNRVFLGRNRLTKSRLRFFRLPGWMLLTPSQDNNPVFFLNQLDSRVCLQTLKTSLRRVCSHNRRTLNKTASFPRKRPHLKVKALYSTTSNRKLKRVCLVRMEHNRSSKILFSLPNPTPNKTRFSVNLKGCFKQLLMRDKQAYSTIPINRSPSRVFLRSLQDNKLTVFSVQQPPTQTTCSILMRIRRTQPRAKMDFFRTRIRIKWWEHLRQPIWWVSTKVKTLSKYQLAS